MSYITTFTKKLFDPINADIDDIEIADIAHALSLLCRANGHFEHFYLYGEYHRPDRWYSPYNKQPLKFFLLQRLLLYQWHSKFASQ